MGITTDHKTFQYCMGHVGAQERYKTPHLDSCQTMGDQASRWLWQLRILLGTSPNPPKGQVMVWQATTIRLVLLQCPRKGSLACVHSSSPTQNGNTNRNQQELAMASHTSSRQLMTRTPTSTSTAPQTTKPTPHPNKQRKTNKKQMHISFYLGRKISLMLHQSTS
jgi:hypothetical protein